MKSNIEAAYIYINGSCTHEIHVQLVPGSNKLPYFRVELEFMTHGCKVCRQYK